MNTLKLINQTISVPIRGLFNLTTLNNEKDVNDYIEN